MANIREIEARIAELAKDTPESTLEGGVGAALLELCREDARAADIIGCELHDDTIKTVADKLEDYARKNKNGNTYYMAPAVAKSSFTSILPYRSPRAADPRLPPASTLTCSTCSGSEGAG